MSVFVEILTDDDMKVVGGGELGSRMCKSLNNTFLFNVDFYLIQLTQSQSLLVNILDSVVVILIVVIQFRSSLYSWLSRHLFVRQHRNLLWFRQVAPKSLAHLFSFVSSWLVLLSFLFVSFFERRMVLVWKWRVVMQCVRWVEAEIDSLIVSSILVAVALLVSLRREMVKLTVAVFSQSWSDLSAGSMVSSWSDSICSRIFCLCQEFSFWLDLWQVDCLWVLSMEWKRSVSVENSLWLQEVSVVILFLRWPVLLELESMAYRKVRPIEKNDCNLNHNFMFMLIIRSEETFLPIDW